MLGNADGIECAECPFGSSLKLAAGSDPILRLPLPLRGRAVDDPGGAADMSLFCLDQTDLYTGPLQMSIYP